MNPHFKYFVEEAHAAKKAVIDRCNLTIFYEPGYEWLPEYLAKYRVQVIASLPCYTMENVEKQVLFQSLSLSLSLFLRVIKHHRHRSGFIYIPF
jgi:hypothetical protein